jgi:hypothetical protein
MKTFIPLWIASRLGVRARALRRSLRDYQKHENARIFELEHRSRGLRLYASWVRNKKVIPHREKQAPLLLPKVTGSPFRNQVKLAA